MVSKGEVSGLIGEGSQKPCASTTIPLTGEDSGVGRYTCSFAFAAL